MVASWRVGSVDIRIGADRGAAPAVLAALRLDPRQAAARAVELLDRAAPGAGRLLAVGATLELCRCADDDAVSVLRIHDVPLCRLPGAAWAGPDAPGLSEDWDGVRSKLTVAHAMSGPAGRLTTLTPRRRDLLAELAGLRLGEEPLVRLGGVRELSWTIQRDHLDLRVRRWTSGSRFDILEVECRCSPADAGFIRPAVRSLVVRHGMDPGLGLDPLELRAAAELAAITDRSEPGSGLR